MPRATMDVNDDQWFALEEEDGVEEEYEEPKCNGQELAGNNYDDENGDEDDEDVDDEEDNDSTIAVPASRRVDENDQTPRSREFPKLDTWDLSRHAARDSVETRATPTSMRNNHSGYDERSFDAATIAGSKINRFPSSFSNSVPDSQPSSITASVGRISSAAAIAAYARAAEQVSNQPIPTPSASNGDNRSFQEKDEPLRIKDLREILEHIFMVGTHHRHQKWRETQYLKIQGVIPDDDSGESTSEDAHNEESLSPEGIEQHQTNSPNRKRKRRTLEDSDSDFSDESTERREDEGHASRPNLKNCHMEDFVVYGMGKVGWMHPIELWPFPLRHSKRSRRTTENQDYRFAQIYRDGLVADTPNDTFRYKTRPSPCAAVTPLSIRTNASTIPNVAKIKQPPEPARGGRRPTKPRAQQDEETLQNSKDEHRIRAFVLHCWDRAVHAAAKTVTASGPSPSSPTEIDDREDKSNVDLSWMKYTHAQAKDSCSSLGINIEPPISNILTCPSCHIATFDTEAELMNHYYGRVAKQHPPTAETRGCCWAKIKKTQERLIYYSLAQEAVANAGNFIAYIMDCAHATESPVPTQLFDMTQELNLLHDSSFKWFHLIDMLRDACPTIPQSRAHSIRHLSPSDTIRLANQTNTTVLNASVVESIAHRAILRYGNIPK